MYFQVKDNARFKASVCEEQVVEEVAFLWKASSKLTNSDFQTSVGVKAL